MYFVNFNELAKLIKWYSFYLEKVQVIFIVQIL